MNQGFIWMTIFLGIVLGVCGAFALILIKKKSLKKKALKDIEEQRLKFQVNGKTVDFFGNVKKESGTDKKKEEKVEKKPANIKISKSFKKVRVRKKKQGKKK